ncbi:hypothetical protein K1T71_012725 [Dendrolimus kikuchii]|uniref:Uncharacterized protein n=1 Tax=Dendrolimus kikuchii TaxID=765133 RepID=A0ACC1CK94_9NEOP|nr:hypothetical protein K1T71_012725 [Dendrolimus kikuchii]
MNGITNSSNQQSSLDCAQVILSVNYKTTMKIIVIGIVFILTIGYMLYLKNLPGPLPQLDPEEWWGPTELKSRQDKSIRPFTVKFDEAMIKDLKDRIKSSRPFTKPLEGVAFQYGFNSDILQGWLKYWSEEYPFADRVKFLNQFPHYKTNIQGLDIHFIRVKPQVPAGVEILPILMIHGWPGSVREFYEAIPLLTKQTPGYNFAFEVIVPSLPGYGFSDAAVRPGLATPQTAVIFRTLMHRLGHKKFYVQGGDWGASVASQISTLFPDDILGHHSNMAFVTTTSGFLKTFIGAYIPSLIIDSDVADRMYPLSSFFAYLLEEFGYAHIQATKPDTIGVALTDSPAGLLAYILEKFSTWTRKQHKLQQDGGLGFRFTKDQLIDNVMIYWSTNSITTSRAGQNTCYVCMYVFLFSLLYSELYLHRYKSPVPTWALQAKEELFYQPPSVLRTKYPNLLNVTVIDEGGHFLAFELPKVVVEDVFRAVKAFREWRQGNQKTEL